MGWTTRRRSGGCDFSPPQAFLDITTGTGDLAIEAAERNSDVRVTGVDLVEEMLVVGRQKVEARGLGGRIRLEWGDTLALPFGSAAFDVSAMAFGMRNIPDSMRALQEMARVTVPGGQVMVLEFTFAPARGLRWLYGFIYATFFRGSPVLSSATHLPTTTWRIPSSPTRRRTPLTP